MMLREGLQGIASPPPQYYLPSSRHHPHHPPPEFSMSLFSPSTSSRLSSHPPPPPPPHGFGMPGSGGLFSIADISSPGVSFHQMSIVDASTPTNINISSRGGMLYRQGQGAGDGTGTGIKDLNNFLPLHKIRVDGYPKRLFTVENNVTGETIVGVTSAQSVQLFLLKIKSDEEAKTKEEKFEFDKFHEISIQPNDLEGFVISQNCSITLVPFKLTYALSTRSGKNVYVYDQGDSKQVPNHLSLAGISEYSSRNSRLIPFPHDYPVTHLAIDSEKDYLGCIQELGCVVVWDIPTKTRLAVFHVPNQGVHISFHRSEPYQLLVIDANGWARFFNVFRQCCFRTLQLTQSNVFSAEWSLINPSLFAAGFAESFSIIDTSKVISSMNKCYETPELIINAVKISPNNDKVFATLSRLTGTIQLWKDNFGTHIWKHRNSHVNDIAWVHGYPYLLALGHQTLFIYDSSVS